MGQDDVRTMDEYLEGHPELGSRSLFIRTAVREYINRDAGVSAGKGPALGNNVERDVCIVFPDGSGEVTVRLPKRHVDTIRMEIDKVGYMNAGELIRSWFLERHMTQQQKKEIPAELYARADSDEYIR